MEFTIEVPELGPANPTAYKTRRLDLHLTEPQQEFLQRVAVAAKVEPNGKGFAQMVGWVLDQAIEQTKNGGVE